MQGYVHRQSTETVIGRYEKIVSGNAAVRTERRPPGLDPGGEAVPVQLHLVVERPPGSQGPAVYLQGGELRRSTGKLQRGFLTPVAFAVPVVERYIPH